MDSVRGISGSFRRFPFRLAVLLFPRGPGADHGIVAEADRHTLFRGADHLAGYPDVSLFPRYLPQFLQRQNQLDGHFGSKGKGAVRVEESAAGANVTRNKIQGRFDAVWVDRKDPRREFERKSIGSSVISSLVSRLQILISAVRRTRLPSPSKAAVPCPDIGVRFQFRGSRLGRLRQPPGIIRIQKVLSRRNSATK
jgi:hypothetical protein